ncbi:hypothetical protein N4Q63_26715, partial [Leclercia adecarboxylata]|uniref:hypothetical protein n=1 Tax=Leclercia adecarboxylata TaxID=83655 RepID=UPI00234C2DDA|nr:hypothetical protein [Leclercia adecarboxylata]
LQKLSTVPNGITLDAAQLLAQMEKWLQGKGSLLRSRSRTEERNFSELASFRLNKTGRGGRQDSVRILRAATGHFFVAAELSYWREPAFARLLLSMEQLETIVQHMLEFESAKIVNAARTKKVQSLKKAAVEARIREMAAEEQFDYKVEE